MSLIFKTHRALQWDIQRHQPCIYLSDEKERPLAVPEVKGDTIICDTTLRKEVHLHAPWAAAPCVLYLHRRTSEKWRRDKGTTSTSLALLVAVLLLSLSLTACGRRHRLQHQLWSSLSRTPGASERPGRWPLRKRDTRCCHACSRVYTWSPGPVRSSKWYPSRASCGHLRGLA